MKKIQRVKKLEGFEISISLKICKDLYDVIWVIQIIKIKKKKNLCFIYDLYFFLLRYILDDKLHYFMKNI